MMRAPLLMLILALCALPALARAGSRGSDDAVARASDSLAEHDTTRAIDILVGGV